MGVLLIFAATAASWGWFALNVLEVILGLGMVIFVHELGHFVVAKLCGVKCEKFYLGFDIAGLKLARFRWGETEYGIGILPFGGYVKMLGQEDNPARLREEIERAKPQRATAGAGDSASPDQAAPANSGEHPEADAAEGANDHSQAAASTGLSAAEQALYDPRSYLAQSVPERMAIISAGVIMNVVFALVTGAIAYAIGVRQIECAVGAAFPGEAAWKAGLQVDDRIQQIAGRPVSRFSDLQRAVSLGDIDHGVPMVVERPGEPHPIALTLVPDRTRLAPTIGIVNASTTTLSRERPPLPGSPADLAAPKFQEGDRIVRIDGEPIQRYGQIQAHLAQHPEKPLNVTVQRDADQGGGGPPAGGASRQLSIDVAPAPMRRLGVVMQMGPITAVQAGSPAEMAGIQAQDRIVAVDDQPPGDPMTLPDRLRKKTRVTLSLRRENRPDILRLPVELRPLASIQAPALPGNPMSIPGLGLAYQVLNRVETIEPESPAARADIAPGDAVRAATLIPPSQETLRARGLASDNARLKQRKVTIPFDEKKANWPYFCYLLQDTLPGTQVELDLGDDRTVTLEPVDSTAWFNPDRGFAFEPLFYVQKARSTSEAVALGAEETWNSLTLVFRSVKKVSTGQVSLKGVGGPWEIIKQAVAAAAQGVSPLLMFLTLISANLAVLNFLPIPLLDGGHMVFLAYEGIMRKPPNEQVQVALTYLGLLFILSLMIWVIGLDFGLISRH